jgi:hypothetical protein
MSELRHPLFPKAQEKTVAFLSHGESTIEAISGWSEPKSAPGVGANTKNVLALARDIRFPMQINTADFVDRSVGRIDGIYLASHAELKIAVQYLHKHGIELSDKHIKLGK